MRVLILAAAVSLLAGAAQADQAAPSPNAQDAAQNAVATEQAQAKAKRVVYVCDRSDLTRRGFAREHGEVKFVTAEQVLTGAADDWSAPRCVSEAEGAKLSALLSR